MVPDGTRGGRHENDEADRKPAVEDASHDAGGLPLVPIELRFDVHAKPLEKGETTLRIAWEGKLSSTDTDGAFRQQENGAWYVITHLEPLGARRIFPGFDEPSFKVPWKVSLRIRKEDNAFFNTPVESALFRRVWAGYADAFSEAGCGWGFTYLDRPAPRLAAG